MICRKSNANNIYLLSNFFQITCPFWSFFDPKSSVPFGPVGPAGPLFYITNNKHSIYAKYIVTNINPSALSIALEPFPIYGKTANNNPVIIK